MTFGGLTAQRLALLIAILATLVVLGCWDNKRSMDQVLENGRETLAQVTGAQYQRKMPFALDAWRPRFVEQDVSVDLTWRGTDGKPREHRKVPVSESLARTIVSGDQVRLITLPVKVTDNEIDTPVILTDSARRRASLQIWIETAGYTALAAWAVFAALVMVSARRGETRHGVVKRAPVDIPPRRTMLGIGLLLIGGFMAFKSWSETQSFEAMTTAGTEVTADILRAINMPRKPGDQPSYAIQLGWRDATGAVHHFGPTHVSDRFWNEITRDGELIVKKTQIRVRDDDPSVRPLIVADAPEQGWQARFGQTAGIVFMLVGIGCLFSAMRSVRRQARH